jgi:hypothetical protein
MAPSPPAAPARPSWSLTTAARPRGLALARERGWLLAWDEANHLYLVNRKGERQAHHRPGHAVTAGCAADDGSAFAATGGRGEVWWFAPDLAVRWERPLQQPAVSAALDPHGQYLAVGDARGGLRLFDRQGRTVCQAQAPRALHHLAFVPEAALLLACSDVGLVAGFDLAGRCLWRDGFLANVGSLAVSGSGDRVVLACFTEGLRFYGLTGQKLGHQVLPDPCRLCCLSYDGRLALAAGLSGKLTLLDRDGAIRPGPALDPAPVALALAPLGDSLLAALPDCRVVGLDLAPPANR